MNRSVAFIPLVLLLAVNCFPQQDTAGEVYRFAVSGDSRNCGDVVMPAIAASAVEHHVDFYWHLGDFRMMGSEKWGGYKAVVDDDMCQEFNGKACEQNPAPGELSAEQYRKIAWGDFIAHQVAPFGTLPVFLGIGNHEMYKYGDSDPEGDKSHADFVLQFAYWLNRPEIARTPAIENVAYYHWKKRPVDFIYLDNSKESGFDGDQLNWLQKVLDDDQADGKTLAVVVGMHRALSNSLACGHSMNGDVLNSKDPNYEKRKQWSSESLESGRTAYLKLVKWRKDTGRKVYVLASHSHFYMENIFDTEYWRNPSHQGSVLPGWIVGTAGARRYVLPPEVGTRHDLVARVNSYGYLLASVRLDGTISFRYEDLSQDDVPPATRASFGKDFVEYCFMENRDTSVHEPPPSCHDQ